jgi:hypothetical protein
MILIKIKKGKNNNISFLNSLFLIFKVTGKKLIKNETNKSKTF